MLMLVAVDRRLHHIAQLPGKTQVATRLSRVEVILLVSGPIVAFDLSLPACYAKIVSKSD